MQAVTYDRRGPAREVLTLADRPTPEPGPGEVRVKVAVSAVNPSDTKGRGIWLGATHMPFPLITPHQDGSGVIDKVGAGVVSARVGERVWIYMAQRGRPFGTAAEVTGVPAERAELLPRAASYAEGACRGIPVMTAHSCLFRDGPVTGKTVLVQGGAGGVGFYAVQLAKWGGAKKVIAAVSRDAQATQARQAGADAIVNYKQPDAIEQVRAAAGGPANVDHVVEVNFGANVAMDLAVIARNGVIASYGSDGNPEPTLPYGPFTQKDVTLRMALIYEAAQSARDHAARDIDAMLQDGRLKHQVARRFPLDAIAAAHEAMESGTTMGKLLLDVAAL